MAVSRVSLSSITQGFPKSRSFLDGNSAYIPSSFESIATATPTSGSTVTFSSIPSTYKHLQLRIHYKQSSSSGNVIGYFNGITTASSYTMHLLYGTGAAVAAVGYAAGGYGAIDIVNSSGAATYPAVSIVDILDYASTTKNKVTRSTNGYDANGSGMLNLSSSMWLSTSAITSIRIDTSGTFASGTTIALYGIKG